jgi:2-hydroxychromene-2-carboxylate isomerase
MATNQSDLEFYFSPVCPWAWRTALWAREVAAQRPVNIHWKLFSLAVVNQGKESGAAAEGHAFGYKAERLLVAARRRGGNAGVERLYMAIGDALHGRREERSDALLTGALAAAGLPAELLAESQSDASVEEELLAEHKQAAEELGAFGVPTLRFPDSGIAFFGPVVDPVPTGAAAVELWDHVAWSLEQPYLFELKRERKGRPAPLGLAQVSQRVEPVPARA